ncbi:putative DD41D transposase [Trichonephila clavipes]|nr:putative DD41D transposase [Trichonephila clavipes]
MSDRSRGTIEYPLYRERSEQDVYNVVSHYHVGRERSTGLDNRAQALDFQNGCRKLRNPFPFSKPHVLKSSDETPSDCDDTRILILSDEAHFWLNGYVNKLNCRFWSKANPQVYVETPLHPEKLTAWCALWAGGILLQKR